LENHAIDVDVFLAESEFQQQIIARRQRVELDNSSLMLVSPEDLILLKLLAGRPRDYTDVQDILFTLGTLDEKYMRHWAKELGLSQKLEKALNQSPE
jgi:predicted nucleotidyltransferase